MNDLTAWRAIADSVTPRTRLFIGGEFTDAASGDTFETFNPADGTVLATVARGASVDVDRAVAAARASFERGVWSRAAPGERKRVLLAVADAIRAAADELAVLDSLDGGKLISATSTIDVPGTAAILQWYAEAIDKRYGEVAPVAAPDLAIITREPVGVVGAVVPWNYPLETAMWKIAPALAAGNSVVLKPAEESPLSALRLAEIAVAAGLPEGVLNVVSGLGVEAGQALGLHPDVDVIAFTGSTAVGKRFLEYSARSNMKAVWLECGGKSANLVFPDVDDLEMVADAAAAGIFTCSGQVCSANSRLLVHSSIAERLSELVAERAAGLVVGDPLDPATQLGPLVSARQLERVHDYMVSGSAEARLVTGGVRAADASGGYFASPTVFAGVRPDARIATEEIFGPVLAVTAFETEAEAVALANASEYGLAASVFTDSIHRAHRVASALKVGTVSVNTVDALDVTTPFGGVKQSGSGRDLSLHAFDNYTSLKTTWFAGR
ncbi:aldehyde dehydrogenase family protein [Pseudoclavibacter helvolus]|uniref:Gamma-glutamyl-gamma-aminobutyraldehyde dehydrogenase n=1 Tax=Pseudoclavibacter helvolus TaxID=255205 RepID=A0A7W4YEH5_9MICO|nr:aldehyde dehydrogenase family protein [Pseudoclavibacter helvolus]MBB2957544.1 gamma-glutamyl-gamma-aminobutyraldehyde dehydrogenase [Pseudoclavibacter helvolus]